MSVVMRWKYKRTTDGESECVVSKQWELGNE